MKCAICNNEISDAKGITISEMAELWQARAEKAEGELKAIKARIEAVTEEDMGNTDLDVFIKYIIGGEK